LFCFSEERPPGFSSDQLSEYFLKPDETKLRQPAGRRNSSKYYFLEKPAGK
jgi:hypothetical protein